MISSLGIAIVLFYPARGGTGKLDMLFGRVDDLVGDGAGEEESSRLPLFVPFGDQKPRAPPDLAGRKARRPPSRLPPRRDEEGLDRPAAFVGLLVLIHSSLTPLAVALAVVAVFVGLLLLTLSSVPPLAVVAVVEEAPCFESSSRILASAISEDKLSLVADAALRRGRLPPEVGEKTRPVSSMVVARGDSVPPLDGESRVLRRNEVGTASSLSEIPFRRCLADRDFLGRPLASLTTPGTGIDRCPRSETLPVTNGATPPRNLDFRNSSAVAASEAVLFVVTGPDDRLLRLRGSKFIERLFPFEEPLFFWFLLMLLRRCNGEGRGGASDSSVASAQEDPPKLFSIICRIS